MSDPAQCVQLFRKRVVSLGGSYQSDYSVMYDVFKQNDRHIDHWNKFLEKGENSHANSNASISMNSNTGSSSSNTNMKSNIDSLSGTPTSHNLSSMNKNQGLLVSKNCLSIVHHSKYNLSLFTLYDTFITESSYLLYESFLKPFKLKQRLSKTIYIKNGSCYNLKDFIISFGIVYFHTVPKNYVVLEIEYKPCKIFATNGPTRQFAILNEFFHWFVSSISRVTMVRKRLKQFDDINNNNNDNDKQNANNDDNNDDEKYDLQHLEYTYENEKIEWLNVPDIDWQNVTDIASKDNFDGRHLAALFVKAFQQIR